MERNIVEKKLDNCYKFLKSKINITPYVAIVLGSGLGNVIKGVSNMQIINYSDIPDFPISTVDGHRGRYLFGYIENIPIVIMQGRVHYYEGYDMPDVVLPIRIMRMLGAKKIILTNSSGGVNYDYQPGQLVLVKDHIASFIPNCLRGTNISFLGTRFPDMSQIYSGYLRDIVKDLAKKMNIHIKEGVYLQTLGPSFESPAEINMYRTLGVDLVGMSTACEAIAAKHAGMEICCISVVSNLASGMTDHILTIEEVSETAFGIEELLGNLINKFVIELGSRIWLGGNE